MPNTSLCRVESCCMPPKKSSAWRFETTKHSDPEYSSSKQDFIESPKINNYNMGQMSDDTEVKPVDQMHFYHSMETFSHIKHSQAEEAPLDFSLKKCNITNNKSDSAHHFLKRFENYEQHNGGNEMGNHPSVQMFQPAILYNGNHSPSSLRNNSPGSHASSSCKDSDSVDMDCSQESARSPHHLVVPSTSGMSEMVQENSPEHQNVSRENSPVSAPPSILEEMLKGQQQPNYGIPTRPQTFGNGYGAGLGVYENQIITSPSPPMAMNAPIVHPASMLPLTMAPYFPYGYVDPSNPFMSGYMYKSPETNTVDVSSIRKPKRKIDPFTDSLKSCSVEELRQKLDSLSRGSSLGINPDYAVNMKHRENGRRFSNNTSTEHVTNDLTKKENCETDNFVANQNQMSTKNNGIINHNNENNTIASDTQPNENSCQSQNTANHNQVNGANNAGNISGADDTNDSLSSSMPQTSPNGRRRNPSQDYKDDPNYRMKRAKNNLAARRSRESRRIKEEIIRQTAAVLEQQNKVIMRDLTTMRLSYDEAKMKYFSLLKDYENMKIQNSILTERLSQKRCGQCGSALPSVN